MLSPSGSDLPEFGLLRDAAGLAFLARPGGISALAPMVERLDASLLEGAPELLIDRMLRRGGDLIERLFAAGDESERVEVDAFASPLAAPGKVIALGRTFAAHARELGNLELPEPLIFGKLAENLRGSGARIELPTGTADERFDNEIELACVLGRDLVHADPDEARAAIAGFLIANDFTWRSEQDRAKKAGQPWFLAKNLPGALPCGPALVPAFLLPDPLGARLVCRVNGAVVQDTDYRGMAGDPASLLAWLSQRLPLAAGDMVLLGTPAGVSTVAPGDEVAAEVLGLGTLRFTISGGPQ